VRRGRIGRPTAARRTWAAAALALLAAGGAGGVAAACGGHPAEKSGDVCTARLVGVDGTTSDAFPATVSGDDLVFEVPITEASPARLTLRVTGEGAGTLSFDGDSAPWEFKKVDTIPKETT